MDRSEERRTIEGAVRIRVVMGGYGRLCRVKDRAACLCSPYAAAFSLTVHSVLNDKLCANRVLGASNAVFLAILTTVAQRRK
jgi:hypothetical protein